MACYCHQWAFDKGKWFLASAEGGHAGFPVGIAAVAAKLRVLRIW